MSAEDESSWRLLFSITLSHGRALRSGRLTWEGWMVFLSSAGLIGTTTGVFPVLLDRLWQRQALSAEAAQTRSTPDGVFTSPSVSLDDTSLNASDVTQRIAFVEFGGFVDMMKVLCLRVYQTSQFAKLQKEQGESEDAVLLALRRCAEDRVRLTEAVRFTASHYLKPFISKSTIHASSKVSLRASRNGWAMHVNRLVTHIVGSLAQTTIVPIYRTYANTAAGRMTEGRYRAFLRDYLPGLSPLEETCALAIFSHGGFPEIRTLLNPSLPLASTSADVALLRSTPTLGLTDFMEALLMLAVVVSADEEQHPSLRPITAKVWVFFERYLCNGRTRDSCMCADPYLSGRYAAMPPGLVAIFPKVVPLLPSPTLFVEVCNAICYSEGGGVHLSPPPISAKPLLSSPSLPTDEKTPFLTEMSVGTDVADPTPAKPASVATLKESTAVEVASSFFASKWSLLERSVDVPLFGEGAASTAYQVAVGGTVVAATPTSCPEIWKVNLSDLSMWFVKLTRCAVEAAPSVPDGNTKATSAPTPAVAADDCGGVQLIFTPIRSFPVELTIPESEAAGANAMKDGESNNSEAPDSDGDATKHLVPWGCKDVVFADMSVTQLVTHSLVRRVCALLNGEDEGVSAPADAAAAADRVALSLQSTAFSFASFCDMCRKLQWCGTSEDDATDLEYLCSQALGSYRLFQRLMHAGAAHRDQTSWPLSGDSKQMSLLEVLGCLSVLLLREDSCGLCDIPDIPRRLDLALNSATAVGVASATSTESTADFLSELKADLRSLPHNNLRDVPFKLALERKEKQSVASRERRAALIKELKDHHARQVACPVTLPPLPQNRPNAMRLVSQYGNIDPMGDFQHIMQEGAETIKAYFVEKELAIPEWKGN